ncbi:MAG: hypothetical protein AAF539_04140 [Planctomycetota bacterium]
MTKSDEATLSEQASASPSSSKGAITSSGPVNSNIPANWWFKPLPDSAIKGVRIGTALTAAIYFADAWQDVDFWFGPQSPHASQTLANFLQLSGLNEAVSGYASPLFWTESVWIFRGTLLLGFVLATAMALGLGGRFVRFSLWLVFLAYANRLLWLSGLAETSLSLSLAALTFAPSRPSDGPRGSAWTGFSLRLVAAQTTVLIGGTWLAMLSQTVWWDGTGAIALAAPTSNRTFDLIGLLTSPIWHELISLALVSIPPVGLLLSWRPQPTFRIDWPIISLWTWCGLVALLGSYWIHSVVLAIGVMAIAHARRT